MKVKKDLLPKEKQYSIQFEILNKKGPVQLGPTSSFIWRNDPRHLCFLLSRYKFCSKILNGKNNVLEVGCGDAFGSRLVLQTVNKIHAIDFDPLFISEAKKLYSNENLQITFQELDISKSFPVSGPFDAMFALDFIEHIHPTTENAVLKNILTALDSKAIAIFGTPNITSLPYASKESIEGHINLKNASSLLKMLKKYFHDALIFSMNDEVIHTGFFPMSHYLFGIGFFPKSSN
jgi:2-polyprenyl-3-methyl-5-hydroxy-6-metoxy-1,4-benzoquinol methylase